MSTQKFAPAAGAIGSLNPKVNHMPTKQELQDQIRELEDENAGLQSQLDEIADIVAPPEDPEEDDAGE